MATRYPLIIDTNDGNKLKEIPTGDDLNLSGNNIVNVVNVTGSGTLTVTAVEVTSSTFSIAGNSLNAVAFTGNYNDLTGTPTIFNGNYDNLTNKPTLKTTLQSLDNVSDINPTDNQVLQYNSAAGEYQPSSIAAVDASSIDALLDVDVSNIAPASGQILKWDGSAWVRGNTSSGTDADTLDGYEGTHYLNFNNFTNKPVIISNITADASNFTASSTNDEFNIFGGTGISTSINANVLTITNDAPDQTVSLTQGTNISITGSYPNFTIGSTALATISVNTASASGAGSLTYDSATGTFTFTPVSLNLSDLANVDNTAPSTGQVLKWSGTAWAPATESGGGGGGSGDIDAVTAGTGLTGGGLTGSVTLNVDVGTTADKIVQLDSNAKLPAIDGSQLTNINIGALSTHTDVSATSPTDGQVLKWNNTASEWQPQDDATASGGGGLANISEDTTPQLGGPLDFNGNDIITGNNRITYAASNLGTVSMMDFTVTQFGTNNNTVLSSVKSINFFLDSNGGDSGCGFRIYNNVDPDNLGSTVEGDYIFKVSENGDVNVTGKVLLPDGSVSANYAGFGNDDDLKIFHNGTHSIVRETGTGDLHLQSDNNVILSKDTDTEIMVKGIADGAVELYYDNVKKFETTTAGVEVTGTLNGHTIPAGAGTLALTSDIGGSGSNAISQLNTNVTVTDTGTNGTITFDTDGTDRWQITNAGHIIPQANAQYDIGSATNKVRDLYLDANSLHIGSIDLSESSGSLVVPAMQLTGHLIPDTNAAYDLGNAEYKIRHLFLSDNSIKFGNDELPLNVTGNRLHFNSVKLMVDVLDDATPQLGGDLDINGKTVKHTFVLNASGSDHYVFTDAGNIWFPSSENDPTIYLRRGEQYVFSNQSGGHPLEIRSALGGSAYSTGVTNNGGTGDVTFKVPMSAPATLYYQCTSHANMNGTINII